MMQRDRVGLNRHRWIVLAGMALVFFPAVPACGEKAQPSEPRERTTAWGLDAVSPDERTLTIAYEIGDPACEELSRVNKVETASRVELTVFIRTTNGKPCADVIKVEKTDVRLDAPLAGRNVRGPQRVGQP
jgi:hypothetical protein